MSSISFLQPLNYLEPLFPDDDLKFINGWELLESLPVETLFSPGPSDPINSNSPVSSDPINSTVESPGNEDEEVIITDRMRVSVHCFFLKRKILIKKGYLPIHRFVSENTVSNQLIFRIFSEAIKTLEKLNYERNHKGRITQTEMWSLCPEQIYLKVKCEAIKGKMVIPEKQRQKKIPTLYHNVKKFVRFDTEEVMAKILKSVLDQNTLDPSLKSWLDKEEMSMGRSSTRLKKFHFLCEDCDRFVQKLNAYSLILTMPISQSNITMPLPEVSAKDEVPMATSINSNA